MARLVKPLDDAKLRKAKAKDSPYTLWDGGGLHLLITTKNHKLWRLKYRFQGKEKLMALGSYPRDLTLEKAREKRTELKKLIRAGIDPLAEKKIAKSVATKTYAAQDSFENVAREWHRDEALKKKWKSTYKDLILTRLINDVFDTIGHIPISKTEPSDLETILLAIEARPAPETAHRIQGYIKSICSYAVRKGKIKYNPAAELSGTLTPTQTKNYPALINPADIAIYLQNISDPDFIKCRVHTQSLLKLYPMLFTRPSELRLLEWSEIDYDEKLLDIPAEKMKMNKAHFVPLSRQAFDIIESLKERAGTSPYVFASKKNSLKPVCARTASVALRRMGYKDEITPHGWRATARTVARERLRVDVEFLEIQLAHKTMSPNGTAYDRVAFLDERHQFMQAWSDYLDDLKAGRKPQKRWTQYLPSEDLQD